MPSLPNHTQIQRNKVTINSPITPTTDTTHHSFQPNFIHAPRSPTDRREYLKLIHIPFSEDRKIDRIELPLVEVDKDKDRYNGYKELEKQLGSIPEIWKWEGTTEFHWHHRTLVRLPAKMLGPGGERFDHDYLMYTCVNKNSSLPQNQYLEKLAFYSGAPVYGDVFIFSMKPWLGNSKKPRETQWIHMDNHFAGVAYARDRDVYPARILRLLLQSLPKPEVDDEK